MNNSEVALNRYIGMRARTPAIFIIVMLSVAAGMFYQLWDEALFQPIKAHIQYIQGILSGTGSFSDYLMLLKSKGMFEPMVHNIIIAMVIGLVAGFLSVMKWLKRPDRMTWLYVKDGAYVYEKAREGVRALNKKVGAWKKRGIEIYRGTGGSFRLPYDYETKGLLFLGSVGSGKTVSLFHSIQSIVERGDRAIIYDYKGDMTEWLAGRDNASLIAFADKRSEAWWISKDINNSLLARELAATLIKETAEPVWGENARDVVGGALEYLIINKPNAWGFQDVSDLFKEDRQALAAKLKSIGHGGANTIDKPKDDKGANSVMSTVRSGAWIFDVLAQAWGNPTTGFSIRDWLKDEQPNRKLLILRNYPDLSAVSNWLLYIIFNQLFGEVLSLSDSNERRVWIIIDELATLPKLPRLEECIVASRSKSVRFLVSVQTFSSIRERYGANVAQTLFSQFATKIICRVVDADTASALANDMGGDRRVIRADVKQVKKLDDNGNEMKDWNVVWNERVEPTMMNSSIMNLPDPTEAKCVPAWLYIAGFPIAKLEWDFLKLEASAPIDVPVDWLNEVKQKEPKSEPLISKQFKAKPFPKTGKLSKPAKEVDDFENLDDVPDILGGDD